MGLLVEREHRRPSFKAGSVIHWLLQAAAENREIDQGLAPAGLLSDAETATLTTLNVLKRRRDWLVGRWTAKALLQQQLNGIGHTVTPAQIVVENDPDGAPFAALDVDGAAQRLDWSLSISHSHGLAFCAIHPASDAATCFAVGADVEFIEAREENFVRDYFTPEEMASVVSAEPTERAAVVTAIWSAKEAVLKALRTGLRLDTRLIECALPRQMPPSDEWRTFAITVPEQLSPGASWRGWLRRPLEHPDFILTLAIKSERSSQA
jgi:4'-phosphopantetheinyl transferase